MAEWLLTRSVPYAWVTLDGEDARPARIVAHLAAALELIARVGRRRVRPACDCPRRAAE